MSSLNALECFGFCLSFLKPERTISELPNGYVGLSTDYESDNYRPVRQPNGKRAQAQPRQPFM